MTSLREPAFGTSEGRAAARALQRLIDDLHRDGRPTLAWLVEHCPDGDLQGAVQRAWDASRDPYEMRRLVSLVLGPAAHWDLFDASGAAVDAYEAWLDDAEPLGARDYDARQTHIDLLALRAAMPRAPEVSLD